MTRIRGKAVDGTASAKGRKHGGEAPASANRRLGEQIRKILGKHYANKYRVSRRFTSRAGS
jgi:hypothetical protein